MDPHTEAGTFRGALDVPLDLPLARVGSRALAQLIDMMILSSVLMIVLVGGIAALIGLGAAGFGGEGALTLALVGMMVLLFLTQWLYFAGTEILMDGQTPGKRVVGLRVVTTEGARAGILPCLIRNLLRVVDLLPGGYGLGALLMLLTGRAQRLGDLAAGTVVVREPKQAVGPRAGRLPEGLSPADLVFLESWPRRAPELLPARRALLATALLGWLDRAAPGFAGDRPEGEPAEDTLARALAVGS